MTYEKPNVEVKKQTNKATNVKWNVKCHILMTVNKLPDFKIATYECAAQMVLHLLNKYSLQRLSVETNVKRDVTCQSRMTVTHFPPKHE